jgi:hypothetical protein
VRAANDLRHAHEFYRFAALFLEREVNIYYTLLGENSELT